MKITLNGEPAEHEGTLGGLVDGHVPDRAGVAVAVNSEVVPRDQWDRALADGDRVEIVRAVQGG